MAHSDSCSRISKHRICCNVWSIMAVWVLICLAGCWCWCLPVGQKLFIMPEVKRIHRHTIALLRNLRTPDVRYDSIHIDTVGPLPLQRCSYLSICINPFTYWLVPSHLPVSQQNQCHKHLWIVGFADLGFLYLSQLTMKSNIRIQVNMYNCVPPNGKWYYRAFPLLIKQVWSTQLEWHS